MHFTYFGYHTYCRDAVYFLIKLAILCVCLYWYMEAWVRIYIYQIYLRWTNHRQIQKLILQWKLCVVVSKKDIFSTTLKLTHLKTWRYKKMTPGFLLPVEKWNHGFDSQFYYSDQPDNLKHISPSILRFNHHSDASYSPLPCLISAFKRTYGNNNHKHLHLMPIKNSVHWHLSLIKGK